MSSVILGLGTQGRRGRVSFHYDAAHYQDLTCSTMRIDVELEVPVATWGNEYSGDPVTAGRDAEAPWMGCLSGMSS
jgi:hypothetical protein